MDIKLDKKPWYIRRRSMLLWAVPLAVLLIYLLVGAFGPSKKGVSMRDIKISTVEFADFADYIDVEGVVQPIMTIKVNSKEAGTVARIVKDDGAMLNAGDTILVLENSALEREIQDMQDEWEKLKISNREKLVQMEKSSLNLQIEALNNEYELQRMEKQINQERQEFEIGAKSAAQLQLTEDEYKYKTEKVRLQRQGLKHDSLVTELQRELLLNDQERERRRVENSNSRLDNLVVRAPIAGQLSSVGVVIGQQLSEGYGVAEMKVLTQYKISTSISEYYIDRVSLGLPATINYQNMNYPLKVSKVVPEIKDRTFKADLIFTDTMPDNLRVGKSYRLQIELGQPEKMLTVDRGDFIQETGGLWIYKLNESGTKATKVKIHIDRQNPSKVSIADGLREGDRVVVAGYADFKGVDELIIKN